MSKTPLSTDLDSEFAENIVQAARTSIGDVLQSVVYFTPSQFDVLYVRQDLYNSPEEAREALSELVELEKVGFAEVPVRSTLSGQAASTIGPYELTVRFHENGFVVRTLEGDHGVLLTTENMNVTGFEEAVIIIKKLLRE